MEIAFHCKHDEMIDPKKLKDHTANRNTHSNEQIDRLAVLYKAHGVRHPIIVSKASGMIVAGHARKATAVKLGLKKFPVVYQDFDTEELEYAFLVADNAIAGWAELDFAGVNMDLGNLGPDFDLDWLGIKNFTMDPEMTTGQRTSSQSDDLQTFLNNDLRNMVFTYNENDYAMMVKLVDMIKKNYEAENASDALLLFLKQHVDAKD